MPFQLRKIPGLAWPNAPLGNVSQLWAMYGELERTQWLDPAELEAGQFAQVRLLLEHCRRQVPYYRDLLATAGITPANIHTMEDFRRIPLLQKRTYQEQCGQFQAAAMPAGMVETQRLKTSGTSGMPIEVRQTNLVNLWWFAFQLRDLDWCGLDPRGRLGVIRSLGASGGRDKYLNGVEQPNWGEQLAQLLETGPSFVMDIHQDPRRQLEWLLHVQPDYLLSYPPNLEHLASLLRDSGCRLPRLQAIQSIGETLSEEAREGIESGFGVPVRNTYSCVEAGCLASPCPEGHGLHVHAENVLLEVLDADGNPCAAGATGRVVLTTLNNFLTPLIRYEILDGATLGPAECPCGRGLPLLTQVLGKRRPQFRLPGGRRKDSGFLVRELRRLGVSHQHQIIQKAVDNLLIQIVPNQNWNNDQAARLGAMIQEYFKAPVRIEVRLVDQLAITPAGKFQEVIIE